MVILSRLIKSSVIVATLSVCGFLAGALQANAQISGKYFAADLGAADLSEMVSAHPTLFWTALTVVVIICLGFGIYSLIKRKKK